MSPDYSKNEWLLMGVFLLGLPIAAVVGALLGLVGRWKQGYTSAAAVCGLAGGAAASALVFATFLSSSILDFPYAATTWLKLFDTILSHRLVVFALTAALIVSLTSAIFFRRRDRLRSASAITLRQLILAQLFILIALGCWTGMRSLAFEWSPPIENATYKWAKRGWKINGSVPVGMVKMERTYDPATADWKAESEMLREVCAEPWLVELQLNNLDKADELDFAAIETAKSLKHLTLRYHPTTLPPQSHFDTLAKLNSLYELNVMGGDLSYVDLSVMQRTPALRKLVLHQVKCDQSALRRVILAMNLEHFAQHPLGTDPSVGSISYWQNYHTVHFYKWPVGAEDLNWVAPEKVRILQINGSELTLEAAKTIAAMPNLDDMKLHSRIEGDALSELAKCPKLQHLWCLQLEPPQDRASFDKAVNELLMAPKLKCIDWNWGVMKPELDYAGPSEEELRAREHGWPITPMPGRPPTPEQIAFVEKINAEREKRGLGKIVINPTDQIRLKVLTE